MQNADPVDTLYSTSNDAIIEELIGRLTVNKKRGSTFQGHRQNTRSGNVFGGQIIAQALSAAYQTIYDDRTVHSLHAYFMQASNATIPIRYKVDRIRGGTSFDTRHVTAFQKEAAVFSMLASFQIDAHGPEHQNQMPEVPGPEECSPRLPHQDKMFENVPLMIQKRLFAEKPIETRYVHPKDMSASNGIAYDRFIWFRAISPITRTGHLHRLMLAYVSDYSLIATLLYRHGYSFWNKEVQVTSLDHAMWFHRDFKMDNWMLYAIQSPTASNARGLCLAHIFTQRGAMVATVAQEGLIRFAV